MRPHTSKRLRLALAGLGLGALALFAPSGSTLTTRPAKAASGEIGRVVVENFPEVQPIRGEVSIDGPSRHGTLVRREGIIVPPNPRGQTTGLTAGGVIETDGFTDLVVSLQGEVRDTVFREGTVGVVLVPDEEPVLAALSEEGLFQLEIEASAALAPAATSAFASSPTPALVAFPRYRVFFYNSSDKSAEVNLYVYRTTR